MNSSAHSVLPPTRSWAITLLMLSLLAGASAVRAAPGVDLEGAKQAGLVGETASGYLAVVEPPGSTEVRALVRDVNARRRQEYQRIATSNDIPLVAVEELAGKKAIEKTRPGLWIRMPDGSWRPK